MMHGREEHVGKTLTGGVGGAGRGVIFCRHSSKCGERVCQKENTRACMSMPVCVYMGAGGLLYTVSHGHNRFKAVLIVRS
mmetsp:Transcript_72777/g.118082  ORF Transcript_72777/g.118082 Transcript_72777/m.118082 type:complete len:80 (+) Transcript_72777:1655-1894(+)